MLQLDAPAAQGDRDGGGTGFLVPPGKPEAHAEAMLRLMGLLDEDRRRVGEEERRQIEACCSLDRVADMWEGLYGERA